MTSIAFPTDDLTSWCVGLQVPPSLDVVVTGTTMTATYPGPPSTVTFRFKRTSKR